MPDYRAKTHIGGVPLRHNPEGFIRPGDVIKEDHISDWEWTEDQIKDLVRVNAIEEVDAEGNPVKPVAMVDMPRTSDNSDMPVMGRDPALQTSPVKPHLADVTDPMELPAVAVTAGADMPLQDEEGNPIRGKRSQ